MRKWQIPVRAIKRADDANRLRAMLLRLAAVVLALVVGGLFFLALGFNPIEVYVSLVEGAVGTTTALRMTARLCIPLLITSLAVTLAFKMRFWNIGGEGQVLVGGVAAAACMIYLAPKMPLVPVLLIMFVLSALAGAIWGLIPAVFKARWNTNETLFTLMMNYIALQITSFCVSKWENPYGSNTVGIINPTTNAGWFPSIFGQQYMLNVIIVVLIAVAMYLYLKYSKQGFEIAVVGESMNTARYAAINVKRVIIRTVMISGAICGIAGFIAVAGAGHTISTSTAGGRGFTAIIVAWLSKFNSFIMLGVSSLLVFLQRGASEIASQFDLNDFVSEMIKGMILFFILGSEFFINFKVHFRTARKETENK